jgi:23S rRNA-intervening sequence protein
MLQSYRELVVWQRAMELALLAYRLTEQFPKRERFTALRRKFEGLVCRAPYTQSPTPSVSFTGQAQLCLYFFALPGSGAHRRFRRNGTRDRRAVVSNLPLCRA